MRMRVRKYLPQTHNPQPAFASSCVSGWSYGETPCRLTCEREFCAGSAFRDASPHRNRANGSRVYTRTICAFACVGRRYVPKYTCTQWMEWQPRNSRASRKRELTHTHTHNTSARLCKYGTQNAAPAFDGKTMRCEMAEMMWSYGGDAMTMRRRISYRILIRDSRFRLARRRVNTIGDTFVNFANSIDELWVGWSVCTYSKNYRASGRRCYVDSEYRTMNNGNYIFNECRACKRVVCAIRQTTFGVCFRRHFIHSKNNCMPMHMFYCIF